MKFIKKCVVRLMFFILLSTVGAFILGSQLGEKEYVEVEVQPGDSIWSIANQWSAEGNYTTAAMVNWIIENNFKWDEAIHPGETLIIPIEKGKIQVASRN